MSALTPWFSGMTAPKRIGYYIRLYHDGPYLHYWDGSKWLHGKGGGIHWRQVGEYPTWRGLANKPRQP